MSMQHIQTIELTASQSSIDITSIPQNCNDLIVNFSARTDYAGTRDGTIMQVNGSGTSTFKYILGYDGASSLSGTLVNNPNLFSSNGANTSNNTFNNASIYFADYTSSTDKVVSFDSIKEDNALDARMFLGAILYDSSSPITSLSFSLSSGSNFVSGCVVSVYGTTIDGTGTITTA